LVDFFNLVKYPPSLSFLLLSLGLDLIVLYLLSRVSSRLATWGRPLVILGQVALYFFLVHWFVYAALGLAWRTPGGLPQTYLAWVVGLVLLYPACKAFEAFKHRMPATSVWRML
jgi:peptidoglycan/LPS O-acetylase OafA/YrhL